jgi:hypothetical protein
VVLAQRLAEALRDDRLHLAHVVSTGYQLQQEQLPRRVRPLDRDARRPLADDCLEACHCDRAERDPVLPVLLPIRRDLQRRPRGVDAHVHPLLTRGLPPLLARSHPSGHPTSPTGGSWSAFP